MENEDDVNEKKPTDAEIDSEKRPTLPPETGKPGPTPQGDVQGPGAPHPPNSGG